MTEETLIELAKSVAETLNIPWENNLEQILRFCAQKPQCFPTRSRLQEPLVSLNDRTPEQWDLHLTPYLKHYHKDRTQQITLELVRTKTDPIVDEVLVYFGRITRETLNTVAKHHRLSMAAENLIGTLLERYIATITQPIGWIWCCGSTVKATDFIGQQGHLLLQVKNRSNSENSSSSGIRVSMAQYGVNIAKWHRIDANSGATRWEQFPDNGATFELSEEGFQSFVRDAAIPSNS